MLKNMFLFLATAVLFSCKDEKAEEKAAEPMVKSASAESTKPPAVEIGDQKLVQDGAAMVKHFADGNYDAWGESLADNAVFLYSSGDSIAGKAAVVTYWKDRRAKYIKSLTFSNDIWLPMKVNDWDGKGPDTRGTWLMHWVQMKAVYKNDKSVQMWAHQDMHYNDNNKVDRIIMYLDRAPIMDATKDIK